jgi:hypothetical protein
MESMVGQIILGVAILLSASAMLCAFAVVAYIGWQIKSALAKTELSEGVAAVKLLTETVDKFQEGTLKICVAQVDAIKTLEQAISRFRDLMFAGESKGLIEYDENAANHEYQIQELMNSHAIPRTEAEGRVRERDLYKGMSIR